MDGQATGHIHDRPTRTGTRGRTPGAARRLPTRAATRAGRARAEAHGTVQGRPRHKRPLRRARARGVGGLRPGLVLPPISHVLGSVESACRAVGFEPGPVP